MIRIVIADDYQTVRAGVVSLLAGTEIEVCAQAADCKEAIKCAVAVDPDVVLLDLRMPGGDGFETLRQIKKRRPGSAVVVFSATETVAALVCAYELKAAGYLLKAADRQELIEAIRRAASGRSAWTRRQMRQIGTGKRSVSQVDCYSGLTRRERQVISRLIQGLNNEQIAASLSIDVETVKQHIKSLFCRLGVEDRTQAVVWALHNGWAPPS
jgi:DNA-binding NarL/FixJ family response regulator